jgi:hypothetical protein
MKTTVSLYDFERAFVNCGRKDQFSYEGLKVLFDYHEDYEEQTGEELELDVIAMCCGYSEDYPDDIISNYSIDVEGMDEDEKIDAVRDYLNHHTTLVGETSTGFVYAVF